MPVGSETMIERVVRVLEVFGPGERSLSASDIARRARLPVPTAHRIVGDLVRSGLLEREPDRRVRVGLRLWELATRSSSALSLREIALPFMEDLHAVVKQHTQLSVLDRNDVLYIEKLSSRHTSATNLAGPGTRLPALACAPGIVLAAFSSPATQEELLTTGRITVFNKETVVDRTTLRGIVAETRRTGYALAPGWIHADTTGLAVPILGAGSTAIAALSVTTPRGVAEQLTLLPALSTTARVIARAVRAENQPLDPRLNLLRQQIRRATGAS
ncbi:IclR family transcriptional regulator [Georgenia sp. SYP-B2076]|uniref:IclR family transcriptional regulator n=1 Tax=Georgenia sp. SYP-B2076 TaxID=2495881 RepID=UPI00197A9F58|nr:IclR family transcriptional regulator [Georgenia sp. SYP-B2076]